jgi:plasmid maintenance system antidote protein VapI
MTKEVTRRNEQGPDQFDWDHLSSLLTDEDREEIDLEAISLSMAGLMHFCGKNRNQMSDLLGVNRSRITTMLRNGKNLQLKTIYRFAKALGYEFDVTFRLPNQRPAPQPWVKLIEAQNASVQEAVQLHKDGLIADNVFVFSTEKPPNQLSNLSGNILNQNSLISTPNIAQPSIGVISYVNR